VENELSVRVFGRPGSFVTVRIVAHGCRDATQDCGPIRICHFDENDVPQILEVKRSGFPSHLDHGDALAPESVQSDVDCLAPQLPHQPVSTAGVTGADGAVRLVVPDTNIRFVAHVTDADGSPLSGMATMLLAVESDYLIVVQDISKAPLYAPTFAEGSLLDARPGSGLTVVSVLMDTAKSCIATFSCPSGQMWDGTVCLADCAVSRRLLVSDDPARGQFVSLPAVAPRPDGTIVVSYLEIGQQASRVGFVDENGQVLATSGAGYHESGIKPGL